MGVILPTTCDAGMVGVGSRFEGVSTLGYGPDVLNQLLSAIVVRQNLGELLGANHEVDLPDTGVVVVWEWGLGLGVGGGHAIGRGYKGAWLQGGVEGEEIVDLSALKLLLVVKGLREYGPAFEYGVPWIFTRNALRRYWRVQLHYPPIKGHYFHHFLSFSTPFQHAISHFYLHTS